MSYAKPVVAAQMLKGFIDLLAGHPRNSLLRLKAFPQNAQSFPEILAQRQQILRNASTTIRTLVKRWATYANEDPAR